MSAEDDHEERAVWCRLRGRAAALEVQEGKRQKDDVFFRLSVDLPHERFLPLGHISALRRWSQDNLQQDRLSPSCLFESGSKQQDSRRKASADRGAPQNEIRRLDKKTDCLSDVPIRLLAPSRTFLLLPQAAALDPQAVELHRRRSAVSCFQEDKQAEPKARTRKTKSRRGYFPEVHVRYL